jgi:hypothetical protein
MDLSVLYIDPETNRAVFGLFAKKVTGIDKLTQIVFVTLFTSTRSDLIDPTGGGGLQDMIGMNIDPEDLSEVQAELTRRVSATQAEIIQNQIGLDISSEEKLKSIEIVSVSSIEDDEINIRLRITNELGRTRDVVV